MSRFGGEVADEQIGVTFVKVICGILCKIRSGTSIVPPLAESRRVNNRACWQTRGARLLVAVLRQVEAGARIDDVCREVGISQATYYLWKRKYSGVGVSELRELRQ